MYKSCKLIKTLLWDPIVLRNFLHVPYKHILALKDLMMVR